MATRYLEILAIAPPMEMGVLDRNNRVVFSTNYRVETEGIVAEFPLEMLKHLEDQGLCTRAVDAWIGSPSVLPDGDGPYIIVKTGAGFEPVETHTGEKYDRPVLKVFVHATDYQIAEAKSVAIYQELDGTRDVTITL